MFRVGICYFAQAPDQSLFQTYSLDLKFSLVRRRAKMKNIVNIYKIYYIVQNFIILFYYKFITLALFLANRMEVLQEAGIAFTCGASCLLAFAT